MKKIQIKTTYKKMLSDVYTPVGIYLRLRDRFRDTVLLESADNRAVENSFSFIGINAIGGIEISSYDSIDYKIPGQKPEKQSIKNVQDIPKTIWEFMNRFEVEKPADKSVQLAQGFYGYATYDAVQFFETIKIKSYTTTPEIPLMRYRLYQYVIVINHFKDEMYLCENVIDGIESDLAAVESLIKSKDVPTYPFKIQFDEVSNISDDGYREMVQKGIASCLRGDVFQIVLSRRYQQKFIGDEFNVYRALRSVNPSPYLFYFDYGDYKLMGSSPESQLIIKNGKAIVHPIAGTFKRTGDAEKDEQLAEALLNDAKENAEHTMLVDLARNDLSRCCDNVVVNHYRQVHYYSHVIHLVSEVSGNVRANANPFELLALTFPQGTLSGAPKFKAMQLIDEYEPTVRGYYAGCIGFMGFDGTCNQAIMIRTFLSKQNTLHYQAGAGITAKSVPETELQEVNNKLGALKKAVDMAETL
ncbi:anthranilate synthase component I family protein [Panacibacter ginsenosidivorans]|uniref:Anthranilate synthase component 1 n=1 Tax=Panacibacter ginsenosidivorans TaxID=1813871 RepID=A0A5B8V576_9BACT|nr:anthranilate synthase component I family protein [Panacibacter ginsenosidivorans]QEC66205.1 anthranilate synthase component I family protein [Panacibacter ginsenosidivorans]